MRALIVDDDAFVREVAGLYVQGTGLIPVEAADGVEAIDAFERKPFRIVLLDMLMPNRDGLETIAELRKRWPSTRIIAMSGGSRFFRKLEALDWAVGFGADAILPKPFSPLDLSTAIKAQLKLAPPPIV